MATDPTLGVDEDALDRAIAHVRANAARYMGRAEDEAPVVVRVQGEGRRVRANLIRIELSADSARLPLIVKQTSLTSAPEARHDGAGPSRLVIREDFRERHRFECLGLIAAHDHFTRLGDPRFGAVRVLDHLPECRAFVVEQVTEPTLRDRLASPGRITPAGHRILKRGFRNTGAWLREFHALPSPDPGPPLRRSVAELTSAVREQTRFLAQVTGDRRYFDAAARAFERAVSAGAVPDPLPLGLSHGDFAPRNVFVAPDGRVAAFDMAARRRVPVYEDVAYFCMSLRAGTARLSVRWLDPRTPGPSRYARLFLAGYFGEEPVPDRAIDAFLLLMTLDNWSRIASQAPGAGVVRRASRAAADRSLRREVSHLIDVLG